MNFVNKYIKQLGLYGLLAISATSCYIDPTEVAPVTIPPTPTPATPPVAGTADFTKYVAIGNSLTAGYADGGVYRAGQLVAYPALLAQRFALVGGGAFSQPLYSEAQKDGTGYLRLLNIPAPLPNIQPFGPTSQGFMGGIIGANGSTPLYAKHIGPNNNFGVPGIRIADVATAGYGFSNPVAFNSHFERLLGGTNALSNYRDYVLANSTGATFFSMWLGNNDVLGYATAGGTGAPMTDITTFTTLYKSMLDGITGIASKGILVTIPQVTVAPHFKTITRTSLLASINAALPAGANPVTNIFIDASGSPRPATNDDLFLLGAQADYGNFGKTTVGAGQPFPYGLHPNNPLKDASVLDTAEQAEIKTSTDAFNALIAAEATARGLALYDVNPTLNVANTTGITIPMPAPFPAIVYRTTFISGGVFSLDGIHLTPAGNAIVANGMITAINAKYSSTLPPLNPTAYKTVQVVPPGQ